MSDALKDFFAAWAETDAKARKALIEGALALDATYSDPRSGGRLSGATAIADYVGMFSANAPGWAAKVSEVDEVNDYLRAVVTFGGPGPDGNEMVQTGTYFTEIDQIGKLIYLAGFVGTGA